MRLREREEGGERDPLAVAERRRLELTVGAVQLGDLAVSSDEHAGALEVVDQVVRHRLPEVGSTVEERHERATAGEPDRRLGRRVPPADDTDPRGAAAPGLLRPRGVEDADPFVRLDLRDRQPAVLGAGRENDGARPYLLAAFEPDEVIRGAGFERDGAVRRGHAGAELARLADGTHRQLRAADTRREAEVVLDPPRRSRLAAERAALDHERVQPLRRSVDGGAEPGRAAAENEQVDCLRVIEIEPDAERPGHLAG